MPNETIENMVPDPTEALGSKGNNQAQSSNSQHGWSYYNWYRLVLVLWFGLCTSVIILTAGSDVQIFISNPATQNVVMSTTITSNIVSSCYSASTNVLATAVSGTNSVPVSVTVTSTKSITTSTRPITDGQWYALILLLTPLILVALVTVLVFRKNDDD